MIRGTIFVAKDICKGCELCINACPQVCMNLATEFNSKGFHYAQLKNKDCTGCINCAIVCPDSAITVYREPKKSSSKILGGLNGQN